MRVQSARFASAPANAPAPQPAPEQGAQERLDWSRALQLPAYTYGAAGAALSGLAAFADRFPPGGVTLNPGGFHRNPEWTRALVEGSFLRGLQPYVAGASAVVHGARGLLELHKGENLAGALDLLVAAGSMLCITAPGTGAALSAGLLIARGVVEIHA